MTASRCGTVEHYKTDPRRWSTDGDPYSDFMEATGITMPAGTPDAENHPLVAARPIIAAFMEGFDIIPIQKSKEQTSTTRMSSSSHTTTNEDVAGGEVGVEATAGTDVSLFGPKAKLETTVSAKASYSHTWVNTDVEETSDTESSGSEVEVASDRAANLKIRLYLENVGSAPARQVAPTINLSLGGKVIATIRLEETAQLMNRKGRPHSRFPTTGAIVIGGPGDEEIYLSLAEVEALREGAPMQLEVIQVSARASRWDETTQEWNFDAEWIDFEEEIDETTATLLVRNGDSSSAQYWIYAGTDYHPTDLKLRDAVALVLPVAEAPDGTTTIMDRDADDWFYGLTGATGGAATDLLATPLTRHGFYLMMTEDESPDPEIAWAEFDDRHEFVRVSVDPGDFPVERVWAVLEGESGAEVEVELFQDDSHLYTNSDPFPKAVSGRVIVQDVRKARVERTVESHDPI